MKANRKLVGLSMVGICTLLGVGSLVVASGSKGGASAGSEATSKAAKARTTSVLIVTAESIPRATRADSPVLRDGIVMKTLSSDQIPEDAIHTLEELDALKNDGLTAALAKGDKLTKSLFKSGSFTAIESPVEVPPDLLQISFSLEPQRVMGGRLRAGDRVAVLGSFGAASNEGGAGAANSQVTHMVLSKVMVANVQIARGSTTGEVTDVADPNAVGEAPKENLTVTLALPAASAEKMAFLLEFGKVWLAVMPDGAKTDGVGIQTRDSVLGVAQAIPVGQP